MMCAFSIPQNITFSAKNIPQYDTCFGDIYPQYTTLMLIFSPFINMDK